MARSAKGISVVLGALCIVFLGIIIVLCTVSNSDSRHRNLESEPITVSTIGESTTTYTATTTPRNPPVVVNASVESEVCETPFCKTVASDMMAMMDHSQGVSPCMDFYQYACGGVMQKPFLHPRQPGIIAERMIKDKLDKPDHSDAVIDKMRIFYDSCLDGVHQDARQDWSQPIKKLFDKHQFQLSAILNEGNFHFNLDETLANMMKNDFTPFFNMEFEVDREDNTAFALNMHPVVPGSSFSEDLARKVCLEKHHMNLNYRKNISSYDVEVDYKNFMICLRSGDGLEARLTRMEEAVRRLGLMDHLDAANSSKLLLHTIEKTRTFLKDLAKVLPDIPDLKRILTNKDCALKPIRDLPEGIDWGTVVNELLGDPDLSRLEVMVYMENTIAEIVMLLKDYDDENQADLNNILLMLWSERLYTDFVKPVGASVGDHEYCLRTAVTLMKDVASYVYLDSLSQEEIDARNEQIGSIVANVRRAGERVLQRDFTESEPTYKLQKMLEDVITANIQDARKIATTSTQQVNLTPDFLQNSLQLLANRRKLIFNMQSEHTRKAWWMFMQPYDPYGVYNYAMNKIMIPYAAQESSSVFTNIPDYLNYAGIGHMITHLMWHGYDTSGLHFLPDRYAPLPGYQIFISLSQDLHRQYQAAQSYENPSGLAANFSMSDLSWNELLADFLATRLAWEAYLIRNEPKPTETTVITKTHVSVDARRRRRSLNTAANLPSLDFKEKPLPSIGLSPIQLYYLYWAQHHCTASSELSMLEVMESVQPPARMRVNLVLQNQPLFHEAFQCFTA